VKNNHKKNKISIYLPEEILQQLNEEKKRLDRSSSWLLQRAWKLSLEKIKEMPSIKQDDT
jgi:uncharacterized small protein (TIGR04563 family)